VKSRDISRYLETCLPRGMGWACSPQWSRQRPNTFTKPSQPGAELPGSPPFNTGRPALWKRPGPGSAPGSPRKTSSLGVWSEKKYQSRRGIYRPRAPGAAPGASLEHPPFNRRRSPRSGNGLVLKPCEFVRRSFGSAGHLRKNSHHKVKNTGCNIHPPSGRPVWESLARHRRDDRDYTMRRPPLSLSHADHPRPYADHPRLPIRPG
jgi:hypothetical protein